MVHNRGTARRYEVRVLKNPVPHRTTVPGCGVVPVPYPYRTNRTFLMVAMKEKPRETPLAGLPMTLLIFCETARLGWPSQETWGHTNGARGRCTMRSFGGELTRGKKKPYRKALSMNSIPTKESTQRTATSTSINAMPTAIMRSLAASLRMSHGMLCNVTELEAVVAKKKPRGRGSHRGSGVGE